METVAVLAVGDTANKVSDTSPVPAKIIGAVTVTVGNTSGIDVTVEGGNTIPVLTSAHAERGTLDVYRESISAADLMATATVSAADNAAVAGSLTAALHSCVVAAIGERGTSGKSVVATVTPTVDKSADLTIAQVVGAEEYRIYFCLCADNPHILYTITEAERAVGGVFSVVEGAVVLTPNDPATPGVFTVTGFVGDGATSAVLTGVANTAYLLPGTDPVDCSGSQYAKVTVTVSPDYTATPALKLAALVRNGEGVYVPEAVVDIAPLTAGKGLVQPLVVRVDGSDAVHVVADTITACTARVVVEPL